MIERTPLVDDDGSGTVGTIFEDAWQEQLYDAMDEAYALTPQTTSSTGAQDNFDLDAHNVFLRCTGAAPVFSGFTVNGAAPSPGDRVVIQCLGTTAKVANQDTGSTDVHRIITPSIAGQIVGVNGRMELIYDGDTDRWREALIEPGAPITRAFSAANYSGSSSMTWTVAAATVDSYVQRGRSLQYLLHISGTVGGSVNTALQITLPGGFTAAKPMYQPIISNDGGVQQWGIAQSFASSATLQLFKAASTAGNWVAGVDFILGALTIEIE